MKLHLLDHSALNRLVLSDSILVRHRLLDEVAAERILVLATDPLTWEIPATRVVDEPKFIAMVDLVHRITRGRAACADDSGADRRRARVPLGVRRARDRRACGAGAGIALGLRFAEAEKAAEAERALNDLERASLRDEALSQGALTSPVTTWRDKLKIANKSPRYTINFATDFARSAMGEFGQLHGVDVRGLDPSSLPTFWSAALVHVARIRAVMVAGLSPTGNKSASQLDLSHLDEAASYADVFVCEDRRLRAFANTVHGLRCEVLAYGEWAARLTR